MKIWVLGISSVRTKNFTTETYPSPASVPDYFRRQLLQNFRMNYFIRQRVRFLKQEMYTYYASLLTHHGRNTRVLSQLGDISYFRNKFIHKSPAIWFSRLGTSKSPFEWLFIGRLFLMTGQWKWVIQIFRAEWYRVGSPGRAGIVSNKSAIFSFGFWFGGDDTLDGNLRSSVFCQQH